MKKWVGEVWRKTIKWIKINWIYINTGFLLAGILIMLVSISRIERDNGGTVSGVFFSIWYITFPYLSLDRKDKAIVTFCKHFFSIIGIVLLASVVSKYYFDNTVIPTLRDDIICGIMSVIIMSYFVYAFKNFLFTFYYYVTKVAEFINPRLKEMKKGTTNIIQGITAFILTLTGLAGGIVGFITCVESFLKYFSTK